jgi:superfamily II DNA or RNA helicase
MTGRSLRISEKKENSLILDLVGNYSRHGLPSNPIIKKPEDKKDEKKEQSEREANVCPECFEVIESSDVCEYCGAELVQKRIINEIKLEEIKREENLPKVDIASEKPNAITKKGNVGSRFWIRLDNGKILYKFCSNGTAKMEKERAKINSLSRGDKVNIISTAYGDWIA